MLMIRHSIGSRLLCQTTNYRIEQQDDRWLISLSVDEETASTVLDFKDELNIFDAKENEKTWYYSSDVKINFRPEENLLLILADHKTVYPI
ncbi:hypothetical protein [Neobacillus drentensis]|uniref:hypothetical protein n=1 Tax=Neobacillus drentensis TaxID=220684 RepID=UPI000825ACE6|nr:hypothetical protein [Neobacillus drentensis]